MTYDSACILLCCLRCFLFHGVRLYVNACGIGLVFAVWYVSATGHYGGLWGGTRASWLFGNSLSGIDA